MARPNETDMLNDLTDGEIALIRERRAGKAKREAARAFQRKAIATAHAFNDWSEATGEGLTFSTFINTFGYQDADGKAMYEAVERVFEAAFPNDWMGFHKSQFVCNNKASTSRGV